MSFTLTTVDSSGESIGVSKAYVLPNLNQLRYTIPEQIDTIEYPHLLDVKFPKVDIKRVSILVGNNIPYAHLKKKLESLKIRRKGSMAVVIPSAGAFVVLMVPIVVKGFQQTLSRLTLNRVFSLKNFGIWRIMGH